MTTGRGELFDPPAQKTKTLGLAPEGECDAWLDAGA